MKKLSLIFAALFAVACINAQISVFPWTETFEDDSDTRDLWTQQYVEGNLDWSYDSGAGSGAITNAFEGDANARFVAVYSEDELSTFLISPILDISALVNPELTFWYGQEQRTVIILTLNNQLRLWYRTSEASPWVQFAFLENAANTWTHATYILPEPSATYQIAFEGVNKWAHPNVIDNVTVDGGPACLTPSNVSLQNVAIPNADLIWTGNADSWNIKVSTNPIDPELENGNIFNITTSLKPYPLSGLSSGITYFLYVQADCGGGEFSDWGEGIHLPAGDCNDPISINLPSIAMMNPYVITSTTCGYGNNYNSGSCVGNWANNQDVIYRLNVEFMHTVIINMTTPTIGSGIGIYDGCPNTGSCIEVSSVLWSAGDHTFELELDPGEYYLMISNQGSTDCLASYNLSFTVVLDQCSPPAGLSAENVTDTDADIIWAAAPTHLGFDLRYDQGSFDPDNDEGILIEDVASPHHLDNLLPNTEYVVFVRAHCDENEFDPAASEWSQALIFKTECSPGDIPVVIIDADPDAPQCPGTNITLTANVSGGSGSYQYNWDFGFSSQNEISVSPVSTTNYHLSVTDSEGCSAEAELSIIIHSMPELSITANPGTNICLGESVDLTYVATGGTGSYTFEWSDELGSDQTITVSPEINTNYTIYVEDDNSCTDEYTLNIIVNPAPSVSINATPGTTVCAGQNTALTAMVTGGTSPYGIVWGDNQFTGQTWTVFPTTDTDYSVLVTDANNCTAEAEISISVLDLPEVICPENFTVHNNDPILLDQTTPIGGIYTGVGVSGNYFNPSTLSDGNYVITYTYSDGNCQNSCSFTITLDTYVFTQNENQNNISIYPNPNNGNFYIDLSNYNILVNEIAITDINGKIIHTITPETNSDITEVSLLLSQGVFFIRIVKNDSIITQKLIIQ